jgi:chromosome segregation ATPase
MWPVTATLTNQHVAAPLRPLAETAALFRQECTALDQLVEELYHDLEQLRGELVRKGDDLEEGRKKLAERGRQLAEQRKEGGRLVSLLEQQEARLGEALIEIKGLREQSSREREEAKEREGARLAFLEQKLRAAEAEREQLRHELSVLQATAAAQAGGNGSALSVDTMAPLLSELGELRRLVTETLGSPGDGPAQSADTFAPLLAELGEMRNQLSETQAQLGNTQTQLGLELSGAIERAAAAAAQAPPVIVSGDRAPADEETLARLAGIERERVELESELELVRTRATELQEVVNQQRRELVEQRADVTTELRLLRELVEQRRERMVEAYEPEEDDSLVAAGSRGGDSGGSAPDPVVSSVMAQFARLQKDVAQRRKKK